MLVLGIDPGTATTGYGLVRESNDSSLSVVDYGVILTSPDDSMPQRLRKIYTDLKEIIQGIFIQVTAIQGLCSVIKPCDDDHEICLLFQTLVENLGITHPA